MYKKTGDIWQFHIPTELDKIWLDTALEGNLSNLTTAEALSRAKTFLDNKALENGKYTGPFPRIVSRQSDPEDRIAYLDADMAVDGNTKFLTLAIWPTYRGQENLISQIFQAQIQWRKTKAPWPWNATYTAFAQNARSSYDNIGIDLDLQKEAGDDGIAEYTMNPNK
tara:strand:- start:791 stop:1291 length:501 start_codon:yes stop_codon:yes gene_type:complete